MKLQDFLKCKKVRCVENGGLSHLTEGKEYEIKSIDYISVSDNDSDETCVDTDWFEPITNLSKSDTEIDTSNDLDSRPMGTRTITDDLHPEFEALDNHVSEPKFKVGNKVYFGLWGDIRTVIRVIDSSAIRIYYRNTRNRFL